MVLYLQVNHNVQVTYRFIRRLFDLENPKRICYNCVEGSDKVCFLNSFFLLFQKNYQKNRRYSHNFPQFTLLKTVFGSKFVGSFHFLWQFICCRMSFSQKYLRLYALCFQFIFHTKYERRIRCLKKNEIKYMGA